MDVFFNRDKSFAKINLAMNYLSRLVRENMTVFDYDSKEGKVTFLTDTEKLVTCIIESKGANVSLKDFSIEDSAEVFADQKIDERVENMVGAFIHNLRESDYPEAEESFSMLLGAFEGRSKINESRSKLERRRSRFTESQEIINTPEFTKLEEVKGKIVEYLQENKEILLQYEDVVNSIKLTNALGKAFNLSKRSWESLVEEGSVKVPYDSKETVFEMICAQELIRSEITESKENFARTWIKNNKISKLASCIYREDGQVQNALQEAVREVPYLALASKADIKTVFTSLYESSDVADISQKDIREYVARIFEFKKSIKQSLIKELNDSYGINVQNLKFIPTFSNLAKAQSVLFESLAKLGKKETIVRDVFLEFAKIIHKKNGIQTLDVNDFISEIFKDANINSNDELFHDVNLDDVVEAVTAKDEFSVAKKKKNGKNGDDEEENGDPKAFGGKKGDKSKTRKGKDFGKGEEEEETDEDDVKSLAKKKKGKKEKDKDGDEDPHSAYDEAVEYAEPEEDVEKEAGSSDEEMTNLMGELESLFKEIDWDALAAEETEEDEEAQMEDDTELDYSDDITSREAPGAGEGETETDASPEEEEENLS